MDIVWKQRGSEAREEPVPVPHVAQGAERVAQGGGAGRVAQGGGAETQRPLRD